MNGLGACQRNITKNAQFLAAHLRNTVNTINLNKILRSCYEMYDVSVVKLCL